MKQKQRWAVKNRHYISAKREEKQKTGGNLARIRLIIHNMHYFVGVWCTVETQRKERLLCCQQRQQPSWMEGYLSATVGVVFRQASSKNRRLWHRFIRYVRKARNSALRKGICCLEYSLPSTLNNSWYLRGINTSLYFVPSAAYIAHPDKRFHLCLRLSYLCSVYTNFTDESSTSSYPFWRRLLLARPVRCYQGYLHLFSFWTQLI